MISDLHNPMIANKYVIQKIKQSGYEPTTTPGKIAMFYWQFLDISLSINEIKWNP